MPALRLSAVAILSFAAFLLWPGCKQSTGPEDTTIVTAYVHTRASWSPDGKTIAYRDDTSGKQGVYLIDSSGVGVRKLVTGEGVGFSWSPDSRWLAYSAVGIIYKIRTNGDSLTQLTSGTSDIRPAWSPDGSLIAFVRNGIWLVRPSVLTAWQLATTGNFPCWHPNGREVVTMEAQQQAGGVQYQYYILAIDTGNGSSRTLQGFVTTTICGFGSIGPDGNTYVMRVQGGTDLSQIWKVDLGTGAPTQLTTDGGDFPAWSPDGKQIVYTRTAADDGGLWIMAADGTGKRRLTTP